MASCSSTTVFGTNGFRYFPAALYSAKTFLNDSGLRAERFEDGVVFLDAGGKFFLEPVGIDQIVHAQADARGLVAVSRADAALGGADFVSCP